MEDSLPLFAFESLKFTNAGRIIFASEKDGRNHLYSIAATGGAPQLLTPGDFDVEDVTLSADKRSILYTSNQNDIDRRHIWRVSATGGEPKALTSGETIEWNPVETSDGKNGVVSRLNRDFARHALSPNEQRPRVAREESASG